MNTRAILRLVTLTLTFHCVTGHSASIFGAYLLLGTTNVTYNAGSTLEETLRIFYDQHGTVLGEISTTSHSTPHHPTTDWTNYRTSVINYSEDGSFLSRVTDSIALLNGYPFVTEHTVLTNSVTTSGFQSVTHRTETRADGITAQTIRTSSFESSSDYRQFSTQIRTVDGKLLFWSVDSWTNDPTHLQEVFWFASGNTNENSPNWIVIRTNILDSLGNIIIATEYTEFNAYVSSSWTSNSYVIGENEKILSSTSETGYNGANGATIVTTTTFTYDKKDNLIQQTSTIFGHDGSLGELQLSVFAYDQFGNLVFEESNILGPFGELIIRSTSTNAFGPRGRAFDRSATVPGPSNGRTEPGYF